MVRDGWVQLAMDKCVAMLVPGSDPALGNVHELRPITNILLKEHYICP